MHQWSNYKEIYAEIIICRKRYRPNTHSELFMSKFFIIKYKSEQYFITAKTIFLTNNVEKSESSYNNN